MEHEGPLELLHCIDNSLLIHVLWCSVESEQQDFVNPEDNEEVNGHDHEQGWNGWHEEEGHPEECNNLSKTSIKRKLWPNVELLILALNVLLGSGLVASASSVPTSFALIINHEQHWEDMRGKNLNKHGHNDLWGNLFVEWRVKVIKFSIKEANKGIGSLKSEVNIGKDKHKTQVDELDTNDS